MGDGPTEAGVRGVSMRSAYNSRAIFYLGVYVVYMYML